MALNRVSSDTAKVNRSSGLILTGVLAACIGLGACSTTSSASMKGGDLDTLYSFRDLKLTASSGREVPVRMFRPAADCSPCDLIIFSHGAFATYDRYDVLLANWAALGYVVVAPQHIDSEEHPERTLYADVDPLPTRMEDYVVVSDHFGVDDVTADGLSFSGQQFATGHSLGGLIALLQGGAALGKDDADYMRTEEPPVAVVAVSPPGEIPELISAGGYSSVSEPLLVVTGTTDILPGFIDEWQTHLDSYDANQTDNAYALIFEGMNHYFNGAFGRITPEGKDARPAVETLNTQIDAFLHAAGSDEAPSGPDWDQRDNSIVRILQK